MQIMISNRVPAAAVVAAMALLAATPVRAQLNTQHVKGTVGLKAGSQPPPGGYIAAPVLYFYSTDKVKDREGRSLPIDATLDASLFAAGYLFVTQTKILGGNYGFQFLFPVGANNRIQGVEIDQNPGAGLSDSVIQPLSLGWHFSRADANVGYLLYLPTGRYTDGASNNTGFGMWGQELQFGTTVYLTENKQFHAATMATFDFQSKKEDSDTKVGNAMNLEGGFGGDFLNGGLTAGLAYYASFKLSDDNIPGLGGQLIRGKNKTFGLGPEATLAIATKSKVYGFVRVAYFWETYARTATQGGALFITASFLQKPMPLPTK